jgi:hypothetical protein
MIWKQKKEKGLSLNAEFKGDIPVDLALFAEDLKAMHHLM